MRGDLGIYLDVNDKSKPLAKTMKKPPIHPHPQRLSLVHLKSPKDNSSTHTSSSPSTQTSASTLPHNKPHPFPQDTSWAAHNKHNTQDPSSLVPSPQETETYPHTHHTPTQVCTLPRIHTLAHTHSHQVHFHHFYPSFPHCRPRLRSHSHSPTRRLEHKHIQYSN